MGLASQNSTKKEKIREDMELPIIDLHSDQSEASKQIVKACEDYGFFKVINHGVSQQIIARMDDEARAFFSRPGPEKQRAGPADPYGYGIKNIGLNGDFGEVEYLLLQTNPSFISDKSKYISPDPDKFRCAAMEYVESVKKLACEILDVMVKGLGGDPKPGLSGLIRDSSASDSVLRFNHYPPPSDTSAFNIGFGEHTDPQILTLLRSNGVQGLQISTQDGVWVPVTPHPDSAFYVNVGDVLQVMTNGRFSSVKHRVVINSFESRMSIGYFAAPPLDAVINCLKGLQIPHKPIYRNFTWEEYKKAAYTCRLSDARLNLFTL